MYASRFRIIKPVTEARKRAWHVIKWNHIAKRFILLFPKKDRLYSLKKERYLLFKVLFFENRTENPIE